MDVIRLTSIFGTVPDFRTGNAKKYPLGEILLSAFLAALCNADTWDKIVVFSKLRLEWLRTYLPFAEGIPSHDTYTRMFSLLDPKAWRSEETFIVGSGSLGY